MNKEAKLTCEDALISPKSLELISGVATVTGAQTVTMRQATAYDTTGATPVDKGELYPLMSTVSGVIELAYTPKEGATSILVYKVNDDFYLVDVPGYGYTSSGKQDQKKFGMMIEEYLSERPNLNQVFMLMKRKA